MQFTWNPSPLRSSTFSAEYILLPPRSANKYTSSRLKPHNSLCKRRHPTHRLTTILDDGSKLAIRLSAIHFRGYFIRQVSCYTFLNGFRLPWPPSCCQNETTPFVVSDERTIRHLTRALGSSLIARSAYQIWPTKSFHSESTTQLSRSLNLLI